jgi:hypothetical protein
MRVGLTLLLATLPALALGYFSLFSKLNWYDDEGYAMASVQHVLDGHRLYDEIVIFYGPVYNAVKGFLHGVLGWPLTHDNVRFTGLGFLILSALVAGAAAGKESGSALQAAATLLVIVLWLLGPFRREPGHPQEFIALAVCAVPLAASWLSTRPRLAAASLGLLAAFAGLSKINVGALVVVGAGLGLALASVRAWPRGAGLFGRLALAAAIVVAALTPIALTLRHQPEPWLLALVGIVEWGLLTTLVAAWRELPAIGTSQRPSDAPSSLAFLASFIISGLLTAVVFSAIFIARGTTLSGMFEALVMSGARLTASVDFPPLTRRAEFAACLLLSLALFAFYLARRRSQADTESTPAILHLGSLLTGAFCLATGSLGRPLAGLMAVSFVWLAIPRVGDQQEPSATGRNNRTILLSRTVIALVAVFQAMQMYPVAGSQRIIGGTLAIYLGVQTLFDVVRALANRGASPSALALRWAVGAGLVAAVPAAVTALELRRSMSEYRAGQPLDLPGTQLMRLPPEQAAALEWLVDLVRNQSTTVVASPGFHSLYFWAQQEPPTLDLVTISDDVLTPERQEALADAVAQADRPLVITWRLSRPGESSGPVGDRTSTLETRLRKEYELAGVLLCPASATDVELRVRPGAAPLRWQGCAVWHKDDNNQEVTLEYDLSGVDSPVHRMQVLDAQSGAVLADSNAEGERQLKIASAAGAPGIPVSSSSKLTFSPAEPVDSAALSVRLYDEQDRFIRALPVIVVDH